MIANHCQWLLIAFISSKSDSTYLRPGPQRDVFKPRDILYRWARGEASGWIIDVIISCHAWCTDPGVLMPWCTDALMHWCTEPWCAGLLVFWCTGVLVHWCTCALSQFRTQLSCPILDPPMICYVFLRLKIYPPMICQILNSEFTLAKTLSCRSCKTCKTWIWKKWQSIIKYDRNFEGHAKK